MDKKSAWYCFFKLTLYNRHWCSSLNSELVTLTHILLELISVRGGGFCMPESV